MNKTLRTRMHLKVSKLQLPLHKNSTAEFLNREDNSRDLLGKHWQDKTFGSQTGLKGAFYKASITTSHAPSISSSGVFGKAMSAGFVNASTQRLRRGQKASAISKLDARLSENQESRYTTASGVSYLQPSIGTPWKLTTTARGNGTFRQRSARLLTTSKQSVKFSYIWFGIRRLIEDVTAFHARQNIVLTSQETTCFYRRRPDGVAFDAKSKHFVFLEFTRPMDSGFLRRGGLG